MLEMVLFQCPGVHWVVYPSPTNFNIFQWISVNHPVLSKWVEIVSQAVQNTTNAWLVEDKRCYQPQAKCNWEGEATQFFGCPFWPSQKKTSPGRPVQVVVVATNFIAVTNKNGCFRISWFHDVSSFHHSFHPFTQEISVVEVKKMPNVFFC